jgi:hypothetical protein
MQRLCSTDWEDDRMVGMRRKKGSVYSLLIGCISKTEENLRIPKQATIQIRDLPKALPGMLMQRQHLEKRTLNVGIILKCILVVNISQLWSFNLFGTNLQNIVVDTYDVQLLSVWVWLGRKTR